MSTSISEMKTRNVFMGSISQGGKAQTVQNKDNFSEIFDKTQYPTESTKADNEVKKDVSAKSDDTDSIQNHANIQKNKTSGQLKKQTETVKDVNGEQSEEEAVMEAAGEMVQKIAETFGVTIEEVECVLESLGLSAMDLLNSENLTNVVLALNPECDVLSLMTNEELYADLKSLMGVAQELKEQLSQKFEMTEEEMTSLINVLSEESKVQAVTDNVLQTTEKLVNTEVKETPNHMTAVEWVDSTEYDGTVIPKTEVSQETKDDSSKAGEDGKGHAEQNFGQNFVERLSDAVENSNSVDAGSSYAGVRGQDIINQITEQIRVHVKQDTTEMELQLHPASLGNVKVQITSTGGVLTAVFTTENEAVKAALEAQLIQLKENFTEQGLKVESVEVNVSAQGFERSLDQQEQEQNRFEDSQNKKGNRRIRLQGIEDAEEILAEDMTADERIVADMMIRNGNSVDYTV